MGIVLIGGHERDLALHEQSLYIHAPCVRLFSSSSEHRVWGGMTEESVPDAESG